MSYSDERKLLYEFYKRNGICVNCGQMKAASGRVRCLNCLEKGAESQRNRRLLKTEEELQKEREHRKEYSRKRYYENKAKGLCVHCGKPQTPASEIYCIDCAIRNQRRNNKKKCGIERYERKKYGRCYVCNEPVGKCGTMCDKCYEMCCNNLPKKMNESLYKMHKQQNKAIFNN